MKDPASTAPARHPFFISCPRHLEPLLLAELEEMGVRGGVPGYLGVNVPLSREEVYRVVYGSRIASRVLRPLGSFACETPEELYDHARAMPWERILRPGQTFKVNATVSASGITHSHYAALKLKDAVADALREARGERPDVDRDEPDIRLDLFLRRDQATVSLYYSDGAMHRRGYRAQAVEAPLKENLAAAMIRFAGWKGEQRLFDFFCGSGTILLEAAMIVTKTPAGFFREKQGFEALPDFSAEVWEKVKSEMDARIVPLPADLLFGSDFNPLAVKAARENVKTTPFAGIKILFKDFHAITETFPGCAVITNPPYGVRLETGQDAAVLKLYDDFGRFLKTHCPGGTACVIVPDTNVEKSIWFKPEKWLNLDNGALEVRANLYRIRESAA